MKKILLLWVIGVGITLSVKGQGEADPFGKFALEIEGSNRTVGIGVHYRFREHWTIPLVVGLSNEFHEKKWNDWFMEIRPYYLFGHQKWYFPVGLTGGLRFMNDYGYHFPAFYGGGYGGILYRPARHGIGLNIGAKYGKRHHLLERTEAWGKVSAYETYRERPLFFTLYYQFTF